MLGGEDLRNPSRLSPAELTRLRASPHIELLAEVDDVRPVIARADVVVLPSYREGLPRSLLEGGAMGRALIVTDVPGCADVVVHERNGLIVRRADAASLADAMHRLCEKPPLIAVYGEAARTEIEARFDEQKVIDNTLATYRRLLEENAKNPQKLLLIELNEVNFDFVGRYVAQGELPALAGLLSKHGLIETSSETEYAHLEPWIQWVTAHTGKTFAEHGVFRLGDIVEHDLDQIWEQLERAGLSVGAISPMNAKNRTRNAAFFVPDPWTRTSVSGDRSLQLLAEALAQAVGDNASARIEAGSYLKLLRGLAAHFRISTFGQLAKFTLGRRSAPWYGAMFLDRFLADVFVRQWRRHRPDFSTLFSRPPRTSSITTCFLRLSTTARTRTPPGIWRRAGPAARHLSCVRRHRARCTCPAKRSAGDDRDGPAPGSVPDRVFLLSTRRPRLVP